MDAFITLLSHLPIVDLFAYGVSQAPAGFLYDVGQAIGGLHLVAKGFVAVSEATPWTWDDGPARGALGLTTSAMEWVARLGGAVNKK